MSISNYISDFELVDLEKQLIYRLCLAIYSKFKLTYRIFMRTISFELGSVPTLVTFSSRLKLTCRIFMRTTSSELGSVPTNRAWVTASAMFSMAAPADEVSGSKIEWKEREETHISLVKTQTLHKQFLYSER